MKPAPNFKLCSLALAISLGTSNLVLAEEAQEEVIKVFGTYRNTATKTLLEHQETPQGISVISAEDLENRNVNSVAEAVRYTAGVNTELRGGSVTRVDLFNIRGFINYQNFYDGLQLLFNDWNLQAQVDAKALEQIEVFKGPTSTLYGAMPPGGMVNAIAKQPSKDRFNAVELVTGSNNLKEASVESTGQIGGSDLSYSFVALTRTKDGQAETSGEERQMVAPSLDWQITDKTLLNISLYYQNDPDMGIYNTLPAYGMFLNNPNGELDSDAYAGDENWETFEKETLMYGYKLMHRFSDSIQFLQNVRWTQASAYQENTYNLGLADDGRTLNRSAYLTDETVNGVTVDNQFSVAFNTAMVQHNALFGVDYLYLDSNIKYEDNYSAPSIDIFNPDHSQIPSDFELENSLFTSDFDLTKEQIGLYFQDQMEINNLVLIAGARYDRFEATEKGIQYAAEVDTKFDQDHLSKRLGALYKTAWGVNPFISYAESFEPQAGTDRNGNEFDPSEGEQVELGLKYQSSDGRLNASSTVYQITKSNVPTRDPEGGPYDQVQAGEVESKGLEIELDAMVTNALSLKMSYTRSDVEVTKDNNGLEGKTPIWIPEQQLSSWLGYQFNQGRLLGSSIGAGVRHIGETQLDAVNSDTVPGVTLVDLAAKVDLGSLSDSLYGATLGLSVNNLFDQEYYSCYDPMNCWFGASRSVEARIKYEF